MNVPATIFREYDIRGIVGQELTTTLAEHLGKAVGTYVRNGGGHVVVVGQDCRPSGANLAQGLAKGLQATGCDVLMIEQGPTPMCYFAIHHLKADGGIMVTGSHNPPEYNGFKITLLGKSLHGPDITLLRETIEQERYATGEGKLQVVPVLQDYIDAMAEALKPAKRALKVVVDAGNGTGGITAVPLYRRLGYQIIPLYCDMDGQFPNHHPDPSVESNLEDLRQAIAKEQADIGLAFDGDADRVGVLDKHGKVIWGDKLMIILSRAVLQEVPGATILGEVKCSHLLYEDIARHGGKPVMWRTGHSLIKAKMKEEKAALAGEMSGHIFFAHRYYGFDDGVYAGGRLLEILSHSNGDLTDLLADVPVTVATPEIRLDCPEEHKFTVVERALAHFQQEAKLGSCKVIAIDGARVEWPYGWGLVRPSNTQPILVLRFEATHAADLERLQQNFQTVLSKIMQELGISMKLVEHG